MVQSLKAWQDLSAKYLIAPESVDQMCHRIFHRFCHHPLRIQPNIGWLFVPVPSLYRIMVSQHYSTTPAPLMNLLVIDHDLLDKVFYDIKGARLDWALEHVPPTALDGYFNRHPDSTKLTKRLEIDLGL
jgi:hypothetical protein